MFFVLYLLCCGCSQASSGLGVSFAELWLFSGFPWSWNFLFLAGVMHGIPVSYSCLCWAVVVNKLLRYILRMGCLLPHVYNMYSLDVIQLVLNLTTRACGSTVVYPWGFGVSFMGGFAFCPVSLTCIFYNIM